jgi:hypothetical protein
MFLRSPVTFSFKIDGTYDADSLFCAILSVKIDLRDLVSDYKSDWAFGNLSKLALERLLDII